jgi:ribonucleoside-triphosphate reductase
MTDQPKKCQEKTEVYSRVCGFFRPVQQWNKGKEEEYMERREYKIKGLSDGGEKDPAQR